MELGGRTEAKRGGETAWGSGSGELSLPERPLVYLESSREVTIRYRGQALSCSAVREPKHAAELAGKIIHDDSKEHFIGLYLDGRHRAIAHAIISIGTATSSLVHPREVFQSAVLLGAVGVIIAHNHPSGDTSPSAEDCAVTKRISEAGRILGISLIDSLIVARDGGFYSLQAERPELFAHQER